MRQIRVLVADDDPALREALPDLIGADASLELVGAARDASEAIRLRAHRPDVVSLDVKMPRGRGPRAVREIRAAVPSARMVALAALADLVAGDPSLELVGKAQDADQAIDCAKRKIEGRSCGGG